MPANLKYKPTAGNHSPHVLSNCIRTRNIFNLGYLSQTIHLWIYSPFTYQTNYLINSSECVRVSILNVQQRTDIWTKFFSSTSTSLCELLVSWRSGASVSPVYQCVRECQWVLVCMCDYECLNSRVSVNSMVTVSHECLWILECLWVHDCVCTWVSTISWVSVRSEVS